MLTAIIDRIKKSWERSTFRICANFGKFEKAHSGKHFNKVRKNKLTFFENIEKK